MDIIRLKKILQFSKDNCINIEQNLKAFYAAVGMVDSTELRNLLQIVRPLLNQKGYLIIELPFCDREIGALCYKGDSLGYIVLNSSLPEVNINFALAHELYHVFIQKSEFGKMIELYMNEHYYDHDDELAANLFAGMLLMPTQNFTLMYRKFELEQSDKDTNLTILVKLMNYFEVPYMATLIRCCELKLLNSGEVLEYLMKVDDNQIRQEFSRLWLDEGVLEASGKDDYERLEILVSKYGEKYKNEEYLNARTVNKVLQNMRVLYKKIKGD